MESLTSPSPPSSSSGPASSPMDPPEEQLHLLQHQQQHHHQEQGQVVVPREREKECVHKAKTIHFLGRPTPIVLQNDNGPCPLLAICNVLLLKNSLNLSPDVAEVSQEKLLSLVAERLIDSNSNVDNKDAGYVENQQQNIADAIDLLPRLATGIDVNIKFRRIDDFEFTSECAIFDLLDMPLYHGWIVDPQDENTANAIGFKSYNALMADLVNLETIETDKKPSGISEEETVDFAAATTAALGVPSPNLSKVRSFDTTSLSVPDCQPRKGDLEEEAELMRALKMSEGEVTSVEDLIAASHACGTSLSAADITEKLLFPTITGTLQHHADESSIGTTETSGTLNPKVDVTDYGNQSEHLRHGEFPPEQDVLKNENLDRDSHISEMFEKEPLSMPCSVEANDSHRGECSENISSSSTHLHSSLSSCKSENMPTICGPVMSESEPIYEGEERILDSVIICEDKEPVYEGEVVLAKQSDSCLVGDHEVSTEDKITPQQGELIRNFLRNSASQLTINGLFSLQEGLKERELCVFFRNNHFSTMFKYEGELYLLATDQGYLNQPDLVWEKLNEVNGDTVFVTSNFKEFKIDGHTSETWDERNAMASTADYLASIDSSTNAGLDINSDLQLAIALQQQEFEQQQQQPPQRNNAHQSSVGGSGLVTGPQVGRYTGRNPPSSSRVDPKPKDRCSIM
ncbi:hypothetical protein MLD38_027810 [Melastoma candidum]|uniref:Uncharacterized protein n=1 Tax=Melastoma candidum TaxID=119954 RepID=A0ACB9P5Y7_9MYRT|nr:hypothetical protein MLD38_027810 [Melastoma candidum]